MSSLHGVQSETNAVAGSAGVPQARPESPVSTTAHGVLDSQQAELRARSHCFDHARTQSLNFKQYRNADLESSDLWMILIPVVGWIALLCLKICHLKAHYSAEKIMKKENYDQQDIDGKIMTLSRAINAAGPLAWQYCLERANLHLIKKQFKLADLNLQAVRCLRGVPSQSSEFTARGLNLVSFTKAPAPQSGTWADPNYVMKKDYYSREEAMLNAAVLASNGEYDKAYDAYNEVMFWNRDVLPNSRLTLDRAYQVDLVELMKGVEKPSVRMQAIMKVEAELLAKYGSQEEINKVSPAQ
jgi:hypothetical protein